MGEGAYILPISIVKSDYYALFMLNKRGIQRD